MSNLDLDKELDKTLKYYEKRIKKCEEAIEYGKEKIEELEGKKAFEMREMLKSMGRTGLSKLRKDDLKVLLQSIYKTYTMDAPYRINAYKNRIKGIDEAKELGIIDKFDEFDKLIESKGKKEKVPEFVPMVDFDSVEMESMISFKDKNDGKKVFESLKDKKGEICILYGGGGWGNKPVYLLDVTSHNNDKNIKVDLIERISGYNLPHDYCDFPNEKTEERGKYIDLKSFSPWIGSWRLACSP